ncbi:AN1-type zinc finger protein 1 isoform X3 [Choloepus didactylus]|uniref:AN1-type zinc finger protein 1 isoform X3 n=2 Tax=Choloepus didactylus TaxID=27675 RepID=UPI00189D29A6|nr:AN1-type zinc finger protein 1 isoform X3 [Choloepus didactylus]
MRDTQTPLHLRGWLRWLREGRGARIFFHSYVMVVQEYFAWNTEAESHMAVLRHRHQSDHECEKLEIPKPRMAATQKLVKDIIDSKTGQAVSKRRKGAKNNETAAKVALLKLKMRADGDNSLPQSERIYFQVFLPKGSKEKSKPMFFCHRWSIGKVIDFAASLASLKNDNNKSMAKKLRLCHVTSGEALPLDHTLETWIAKKDCPLYNGGNIILEYLNDEEQFLKNVESYLE